MINLADLKLPEDVTRNLEIEVDNLRREKFEELTGALHNSNSLQALPIDPWLDPEECVWMADLNHSLRISDPIGQEKFFYITPVITTDYVPMLNVWRGDVYGKPAGQPA